MMNIYITTDAERILKARPSAVTAAGETTAEKFGDSSRQTGNLSGSMWPPGVTG